MKIALIGATGQLGTDIVKVFSKEDSIELVPLTHKDIEVSDKNNLISVLDKINPKFIINTSAYHKVDEVEDNPEKAFLINSISQKNIAELSERNKWCSVFISTDYVFGIDEKRTIPYLEADAPGPINVYGTSKLAGENFSLYTSPKNFIIRVSGLYGTAGSSGKGRNFIEQMIKLGREKGEVSVVNDQILTPTYTLDIAKNLLKLIKTNKYGLYHMTAEGQCSWYEFACAIFKLMKMDVNTTPVSSDKFPTRAKRPKFSVLENKKLKEIGINMNSWEKNLNDYLLEKGYINSSEVRI